MDRSNAVPDVLIINMKQDIKEDQRPTSATYELRHDRTRDKYNRINLDDKEGEWRLVDVSVKRVLSAGVVCLNKASTASSHEPRKRRVVEFYIAYAYMGETIFVLDRH